MRTYYIFIISGILIIVGMLMYPSLHLMTGMVDTTGLQPLTKAVGVTLVPWFFLGMVFYAISKVVRH